MCARGVRSDKLFEIRLEPGPTAVVCRALGRMHLSHKRGAFERATLQSTVHCDLEREREGCENDVRVFVR